MISCVMKLLLVFDGVSGPLSDPTKKCEGSNFFIQESFQSDCRFGETCQNSHSPVQVT